MDAIIVNPASAKNILKLDQKESEKLFKGEPYEIAFTFLYQGLLYLSRNDYGNASACFKSASVYAAPGDPTSKPQCLLTDTLALYAAALQDKNEKVELPKSEWDDLDYIFAGSDINVVLLVSTGYGPLKAHEQKSKKDFGLTYRPRPCPVNAVRITSNNGQTVTEIAKPTATLYVDAVSNGRRQMDEVAKAKQQIADGYKTAGNLAESASSLVGPAGALIMVLADKAADDKALSVDSTIDLRQICGLPDKIFLFFLKLEPSQKYSIEMLDNSGNIIARSSFIIPADHAGQNVVLVRSTQFKTYEVVESPKKKGK